MRYVCSSLLSWLCYCFLLLSLLINVPRNKCTTNRPNHRVIWYANINNWKHLQNDIFCLNSFLAFSFAFDHFTFILLNGSNYCCKMPSLPLFFSKISISFQSFSMWSSVQTCLIKHRLIALRIVLTCFLRHSTNIYYSHFDKLTGSIWELFNIFDSIFNIKCWFFGHFHRKFPCISYR